MTKLNQIRELIREFLEYCEIEKNRSNLTLRNYQHYLERFAQFCTEQNIIQPQQIKLETIRSYRLYINRLRDSKGKQLKLVTQNYHVIAIRAFLKYLAKRDIDTLASEKIELAKNPSREVSVLEADQLGRIFQAVESESEPLLRARDKAILLTLFASGIRISELVALKRGSINLKTNEFTVRGKGDKLRLAFLSPAATGAITAYLKLRTDNNPALFISHGRGSSAQTITKQISGQSESEGLTARSVQRMIRKYATAAGIMQKVSPHTFRHSFATDLLRNGADIRSVQTMLGHASITTTQIYTHITNQGLREIHKKFHNNNEG